MATAISGPRGGREEAGEAEASGDRAAGEQAGRVGRPQGQLPRVTPALSLGPQLPVTILGLRQPDRDLAGRHRPPLTCPPIHLSCCLSVCPLPGGILRMEAGSGLTTSQRSRRQME